MIEQAEDQHAEATEAFAQATYTLADHARVVASLERQHAEAKTRCLRWAREAALAPNRVAGHEAACRKVETLTRRLATQKEVRQHYEAAFYAARKAHGKAERWLAYVRGDSTSVLRVGADLLAQLAEAPRHQWHALLMTLTEAPEVLQWIQEVTIPGALEELQRVPLEERLDTAVFLAYLQELQLPDRLFTAQGAP